MLWLPHLLRSQIQPNLRHLYIRTAHTLNLRYPNNNLIQSTLRFRLLKYKPALRINPNLKLSFHSTPPIHPIAYFIEHPTTSAQPQRQQIQTHHHYNTKTEQLGQIILNQTITSQPRAQ